jgi:hypothetical protein
MGASEVTAPGYDLRGKVALVTGASQAAVPTDGVPTTELFDGLAPDTATMFADPHAEGHP